jgi:hypothetical protein
MSEYVYDTEIGIYKKQIDDPVDPSKNHPIHDAVERIRYGGGRYDIILVLDGVSESKSVRKLVPIGRMLSWDLARFCQDESPAELQQLMDWFRGTTSEPKYRGKGNTTVAFLRFDRATGHVDGFTAGDSVLLLALDRQRPDDQGEPELRCLAEVLAPMHCVANYPGVIYNGWRHGVPFEPEPFHFQLPQDWVNAYLVAMSDGYGKIGDEVADRLYDYNEADQILARRFPDFAQVYLPEVLHRAHAPEVARSPEGRVRYADIAHHQRLWEAIGAYYDERASAEERRELELIDLDCVGLRQVVRQDPAQVEIHGKSGTRLLEESHKTLRWMRQARYMEHEDELGLEEYLRQYVMAELFTEAMIAEMFDAAGPADPLPSRLHSFGESLGPVGDDFSVALMRIHRSD